MKKLQKNVEVELFGKQISVSLLETGETILSIQGVMDILGFDFGPKTALTVKKFLPQQTLIAAQENNLSLPGYEEQHQRAVQALLNPKVIQYKDHGGHIHKGYNPQLIGDYIEFVLTLDCTKTARALTTVVERAKQLQLAFMRVGIQGFFLEAIGVDTRKEKVLQSTFRALISEETQEWKLTFHDCFFEAICNLHGYTDWKENHPRGYPSFCGQFIQKFVYDGICKGLNKALKELDPEKDHCHHQNLTPQLGYNLLVERLEKLHVVMQLSENYIDFVEKYNKVFQQ